MIDVLLIVMYVTVAACIVLTGWSVVRSLGLRDKSSGVQNNIPAARIAGGTTVLLVVCLLLTFLLGSADSLIVNGLKYDTSFWLKAADMFIVTTVVLLMIAIGSVAFGKMRSLGKRLNLRNEK